MTLLMKAERSDTGFGCPILITGAIPESLGQLRNLQTMDLCRNRLSGEWYVCVLA